MPFLFRGPRLLLPLLRRSHRSRGEWGVSPAITAGFSAVEGNVTRATSALQRRPLPIRPPFVVELHAFGNLSTRTYRSHEEKGRDYLSMSLSEQDDWWDGEDESHYLFEQDYIPWTGWDAEDGGVAQSGLDENGVLRCGICGAKMKLTKKKQAEYRRRGIDDEQEMLVAQLEEHMDLHTREQRKRNARMSQGGKGGKRKRGRKALSKKEQERYDKYESVVGGRS